MHFRVPLSYISRTTPAKIQHSATLNNLSLNIFIYFSKEHIQIENRKFDTMNNIMKKKRMGKQVQRNEIQKRSKIIRVDMLNYI